MEYFKTTYGYGVNADCFDILKDVPNNSVNMILCDLPYGTTQNKWDSVLPLDLLWKEYERICKDNAVIVLTAAQPFTSILISSNINNYKYNWIWKKSKPTGHLNAKIMPMRNTEDICVFYDKLKTYNAQGLKETNNMVTRSNRGNYGECSKTTIQKFTGYPTTILEFSSEIGFHPTQKPVPLFEYLIKTYTNENDYIVDNCAGSMTTGVAAENLKRRWLCIEKEKEYYDKAKERFA